MDHAETVESVQVQLDIARVRMEKAWIRLKYINDGLNSVCRACVTLTVNPLLPLDTAFEENWLYIALSVPKSMKLKGSCFMCHGNNIEHTDILNTGLDPCSRFYNIRAEFMKLRGICLALEKKLSYLKNKNVDILEKTSSLEVG